MWNYVHCPAPRLCPRCSNVNVTIFNPYTKDVDDNKNRDKDGNKVYEEVWSKRRDSTSSSSSCSSSDSFSSSSTSSSSSSSGSEDSVSRSWSQVISKNKARLVTTPSFVTLQKSPTL